MHGHAGCVFKSLTYSTLRYSFIPSRTRRGWPNQGGWSLFPILFRTRARFGVVGWRKWRPLCASPGYVIMSKEDIEEQHHEPGTVSFRRKSG